MNVPYAEKLKHPRWQEKRLRIMQRDRWECRDCSDKHSNLQVHHCYYAKGDPWDTEDHFLLTLCDECHQDRQELERGSKLALALLMAKSSKWQLNELADELSGRAAGENQKTARIEFEAANYLSEQRWIDYAQQYRAFQCFVEMVLGRRVRWGSQA